jgi:hypothetical protein
MGGASSVEKEVSKKSRAEEKDEPQEPLFEVLATSFQFIGHAMTRAISLPKCSI